MKTLWLVVVLAACGDNAELPCVATFGGNFTEAAACDLATTNPLDLTIESRVLGARVEISIDLGAMPVEGDYSSETLATWHAVGARSLLDGACVYSAGNEVTPRGSFTLSLVELGAHAHGQLDILQYVHAVDGATCGALDNETISVSF